MTVWSAQDQDGYVFVSYKHGEEWVDVPIRWAESTSKAKVAAVVRGTPSGADLYFCPTIFSSPVRREESALPSVWLHADLDEVNPVDGLDDILPATSAWQTSRGRYQCMWRVTRALPPKSHRKLNRRLTYATGADKGGWSITKVLRVPGTWNYKRDVRERVALLWEDQQHYMPKVVVDAVRDVKPGVEKAEKVANLRLPRHSSQELRRRYNSKLRARTKQLLDADSAPVGERSERLWELECALIEAGMTPEECLVVVRDSVWNKYSGQSRELSQLWGEVQKAAQRVGTGKKKKRKGDSGGRRLELTHYSKFMGKDVPQKLWAVDGIWSSEAHGFIAGEPKTFKSFIATDLAVAVASGTPFLNQFEVPEQGPVLMIQEENTPGMMRDRLEKIAASRNLLGEVDGDYVTMPDRLPIYLANGAGMDLTDEDDVDRLDELIEEFQPKLVVLDPLYLMIPGVNESNQAELTPILRRLLMLKQKHDVGLLIVHHYNKPRDNEDRHPGNRLAGSGVLYRWFESVIYLEKLKTPGAVKMSTEHRGHAPAHPMHLQFDIGQMGELDYYVEVEAVKEAVSGGSIRETLIEKLKEAGDEGLVLKDVCDELEISRPYGATLVKRLKKQVKTRSVSDGGPGRPPTKVFWVG